MFGKLHISLLTHDGKMANELSGMRVLAILLLLKLMWF